MFDLAGGRLLGTLDLAMGRYVVTAKVEIDVDDAVDTRIECELQILNGLDVFARDNSAARFSLPGATTLPLSAAVDLPVDGQAVLSCSGDNAFAKRVKLTAIQVDNLFVVR